MLPMGRRGGLWGLTWAIDWLCPPDGDPLCSGRGVVGLAQGSAVPGRCVLSAVPVPVCVRRAGHLRRTPDSGLLGRRAAHGGADTDGRADQAGTPQPGHVSNGAFLEGTRLFVWAAASLLSAAVGAAWLIARRRTGGQT
jgi:hypothetical protein